MTYDDELFDIGLRLLDRQLVGNEDELLGNVDNLLLETVDDQPTVTAIVSGPAGLGPRFGGRVDGWMRAIWRRLRPEADPTPIVIAMAHVERIEAAVTLDDAAQQLVADGGQLERWLRHYLIARIPGATGGPDRLAGEPLGPKGRASPPSTPIPRGAHLVSDLIGAQVCDSTGNDLGVVLDVCSAPPHHGRHRVGPLPLTHLLYGRRRLGAELGYVAQRQQGPWLVAAPLRAWQRADRLVPLEDVTGLEPEDGHPRARRRVRHRHKPMSSPHSTAAPGRRWVSAERFGGQLRGAAARSCSKSGSAASARNRSCSSSPIWTSAMSVKPASQNGFTASTTAGGPARRDRRCDVLGPDEGRRGRETRRRGKVGDHGPAATEPAELVMGPLDGGVHAVRVPADGDLADGPRAVADRRPTVEGVPGLDDLGSGSVAMRWSANGPSSSTAFLPPAATAIGTPPSGQSQIRAESTSKWSPR